MFLKDIPIYLIISAADAPIDEKNDMNITNFIIHTGSVICPITPNIQRSEVTTIYATRMTETSLFGTLVCPIFSLAILWNFV